MKVVNLLWFSLSCCFSAELLALDDGRINEQPRVVLSQKENTFFGKMSSIRQLTHYATEIIDLFHLKNEDVLFVCDWDNTLSAINGSSLPLREETITRNTILEMLDLNIPMIILTSRLTGSPATVHSQSLWTLYNNVFTMMVSSVNNMFTSLNLSMPNPFLETIYNYTLPNNGLTFGQYSYPQPFDHLSMLVYKNVVFSGTPDQSIKGTALTFLLDNHLLKQQPHLIIFVDNDLNHIESMLNAFKGRPEQIMTLYYPQEPVERIDLENSILTP